MLRTPFAAGLGLLVLGAAASAQATNSSTSPPNRAWTTLGTAIPSMGNACGSAVGDVNGDGWLDVVICGGSDPRPQIFLNLGRDPSSLGPRFVNVTNRMMPPNAEPASHALLADLDNDGDQDMIVVRRYFDTTQQGWTPLDTGIEVYENAGGRRFLKTSNPDLARFSRPPGGLSLADLDGDGLLDVLFTHSGGATLTSGGKGFYLRNDGRDLLSDVTAQRAPDLSTQRRYFSMLVADFNGDFKPDLHNAVDLHMDVHYHNDGAGNLSNVTQSAGTTNGGSDMGLAIGDIDNDGDFDIYSTNIGEGVLYVNDGAGHFTNQAQSRGVGTWNTGSQISMGWARPSSTSTSTPTRTWSSPAIRRRG